ncbi:unnamed protein product [Adineta steineri]|uniref:Uncharacterized protein n=1 Tax=Adineta steineri TaxID=433720 RepID=A0A819RPB5_9BILA|nr:unnamed protein product [Adineta steineri]
MMQTESSTVTESNITPVKFKELYSKYNKTLSCPCSSTSISYKNFVTNTIKLHPVCSSRFVSQEWIHALYSLNASRYGASDFRTTASSQFEILSSFCSLAQDIVNHTENDVDSNEFVTIYLLPDTQVEYEVNGTVKSFKNSASARMIMFLDYFRSTIQGNYLISALNTNLIVTLTPHFMADPIPTIDSTYYIPAFGYLLDCSTDNPIIAATLNPVINESDPVYLRFNFAYLPNSKIVSGFFAGCTPLEALLRSTFDCLYEIECLELLFDYFPSLNHSHIIWTNSILTSKQQNLSFNDYLNELLIEEWSTQTNYLKYFDQCNSSFCTYTKTQRAEFIYAITLFISLYGGLVMILRLAASFIVNIYLKIRHRLRNINFNFGSIIILVLFTTLSTQTVTRTISNPSLSTYKDLQILQCTTLNCPCSTQAISYRSFVLLSPILHQVCSSIFITDEGISLWIFDRFYQYNDDWRMWASSQFQVLSDLCHLANKTSHDAIDRFLTQFFIASTVFNETDFDTQLNVTLEQFYKSTIFYFNLQNDLVRLFIQIDQPYMRPAVRHGGVRSTNLIMNDIENDKSNQHSVTLSFNLHGIREINSTSIICVCATNPDCQTTAVVYDTIYDVIYNNNISLIHKIPGFIRGCLSSDSLVGSTLQCLYSESNLNSDCFANLLTHTSNMHLRLKLDGSMRDLHPLVYDSEWSRFPPNTLISTIIREMMVEQWNQSVSYTKFYESCAPIYCTYHQKIRTKTIVKIFITLLSTIGGLAVSLRFITPYFVKLLFKLWTMIRKRKQKQQKQQEHQEHQGNH